jgi:hypothetical protein
LFASLPLVRGIRADLERGARRVDQLSSEALEVAWGACKAAFVLGALAGIFGTLAFVGVVLLWSH